ncbi:MAG: hypothetical protein PHV54_05545 [Tolumonas sp.]|nr:hypothetical protein [Tolumonas sp.]
MKKSRAISGLDYVVDPRTKRSKFIENNKAAMIHGGYSVEIPESIMNALLENDLGFELGILKGQLANLAIIGRKVVNDLIVAGEETKALNIELACIDRSVKLVPQIQKVLASKEVSSLPDMEKIANARVRWLKQLQKGNCTASELAFQFEIHQLGNVPDYVQRMLLRELSIQQPEFENENLSREAIFEKLETYKNLIAQEKDERQQREIAVSLEKRKINEQLFDDLKNDGGEVEKTY